MVYSGNKRVIGLSIETSFAGGKQAREVPDFFHNTFEVLEDISGRLNENKLCVFIMKPDSLDFTYFMGVEVNDEIDLPKGFVELLLDENNYASLEIIKRGNEDVGDGFKEIIEDWLPSSGYHQKTNLAFIYYDERFNKIFKEVGYEGNPPATIYVPIK